MQTPSSGTLAGAALKADQTFSVALGYNDWLTELAYSSAAVGYNLGNAGTITVGIQRMGLNDIPADRENGYSDPTLQQLVTDPNTTASYDYQDLAVSVGLSRYFFDRLALGANIKLVSQNIDDVSASAIGFDFGSVYSVGVGGWTIGARLNNLGQPLTFYNQDNPLPLNFSIGTSFYPVMSETAKLLLAIDATKPQDSSQLFFGGAEVSIYDMLFLRTGYKLGYSGTQDDGTSFRDPIDTTIEGLSLGAGLLVDVGGNAFAVDYAFTQMELLDAVHRFSVRVGR